MDHMYEVGVWRHNNPTISPMNYYQRAVFLEGRSAVASDQSRSHNTLPLDQHPEYFALRAQADREAASSSGKGKSKGKGKDKGKKKENPWKWRHIDNRTYS